MRFVAPHFYFGICAALLMLSGCSNKEKHAELESYVKRVESRSIKEIEPLPELKPYETYTYSALNLRSPFIPSAPEENTKKVIASNDGIHPDVNRRKEALENYPIDSLRMVGTVEKDHKEWALIVDPTGTVYRVTQGNFVGQNHGKIDAISDEKVGIIEIIPDSSGGWRERKASIALTESDSSHKHVKEKK